MRTAGRTTAGLISRLTGGGNLRRRIAISVGLFTALTVLVFGATSWILVARSLQSAADADLRNTADTIASIGLSRIAEGQDALDRDDDLAVGDSDPAVGDSDPAVGDSDPAVGDSDFILGLDVEPGDGRPPIPYLQFLDGEGISRLGDLPISEDAVAVATGDLDESVESVTVGDRTIRVLTIRFNPSAEGTFGGGALRVGIDITNTVNGLRQARAATSLAGLFAGLGAAAMAWFLSRHLIAPVTAVADAADFVRTNDELPERLVGEGPDELGRLVTSFNAMLDDVQHSREQQRRLVADASHELRTPLTSLRLKVEFIQSQPALDPAKRQRLLDGAVVELGALGGLVSELVELASEEATPEQPQLVELADVVAAEADRFRTASGRIVTLETTPGLVETRPKQAVRALTNLLVNADKYSPSGEPIMVRQAGPRIEVRDRGPGIPADDRDRVFDRFYRGRAHQSIEGSGLGLAIVESVAKANGGTVWIDEPVGDGPGTVIGFSVGPAIHG